MPKPQRHCSRTAGGQKGGGGGGGQSLWVACCVPTFPTNSWNVNSGLVVSNIVSFIPNPLSLAGVFNTPMMATYLMVLETVGCLSVLPLSAPVCLHLSQRSFLCLCPLSLKLSPYLNFFLTLKGNIHAAKCPYHKCSAERILKNTNQHPRSPFMPCPDHCLFPRPAMSPDS